MRILNPGANAPFLVVCDHAGRLTPRALGDLGIPPEAFERHIAWDIGAEGVAVRLAEALGAPAVIQTYSRLVIDCNRDPDRVDAVVTVSDRTEIPANLDLAPEARRARVEEIFQPYHDAIAAELDARAARGAATIVVAVHSFTPKLGEDERAMGYGVLHMGQSDYSQAVLALLRERAELPVGDNAPYAMDGIDYTIPFHAIRRGLDYLELEIRQDLITAPEGQARVAAMLAEILPRALDR
jgi:predicted N-formylglutamate amidohydrolase